MVLEAARVKLGVPTNKILTVVEVAAGVSMVEPKSPPCLPALTVPSIVAEAPALIVTEWVFVGGKSNVEPDTTVSAVLTVAVLVTAPAKTLTFPAPSINNLP